MGIQLKSILEKFPDLLKLERGDRNFIVRRLATPRLADDSDMIFISEPKHMLETTATRAGAWVVAIKMANAVPSSFSGALLLSPNPYLAMALIGREFFPSNIGIIPVDSTPVHPTAVIASSARLGQRVKVGPGAVISDHCILGDDVVIGANSVLEPNVKIGSKTRLHPLVFVAHDCEIGSECEIKPNTTIGGEGFGFASDSSRHHYPITHYGRVVLENRVHIGANVQIDRGTFEDSRIGEGTKIDNHCHFGHNIQIGKHTIITGGMITAGSVTIGSHCVFGGRTTIAGHLKITDNVHIMGMSGITKSIDQPGAYGGLPLQEMKDVLKSRAMIPLLPKLRKQVLQILKKLEMEE